jgi:hypothetical protein
MYKGLLWAAIAAVVFAGGAYAQNNVMRGDANGSFGRIYLESSGRPNAQLNIAVTGASGTVEEKANGAEPSAFSFVLHPASQSGTEGSSTSITFKSKSVEKTGGGTYRASGELTASYVERSVSYEPGEAYSGAVYGPARRYTARNEATFEFRPVPHEDANGATAYTDWIASAEVSGRTFPQLLQAVANTDWPEYVANERCNVPVPAGEDYSGPACTGEAIYRTERTDERCEIPSNIGGEGYFGEVCEGTPLRVASSQELNSYTAQNGDTGERANDSIVDQVKIVVSLRVNESSVVVAGKSGK